MKLKQQLREKYIKDMEVEKQKLEMSQIEQKYGNQLLQEVWKDMGLSSMPVLKILPPHPQVKIQNMTPLLVHSHQQVSLQKLRWRNITSVN